MQTPGSRSKTHLRQRNRFLIRVHGSDPIGGHSCRSTEAEASARAGYGGGVEAAGFRGYVNRWRDQVHFALQDSYHRLASEPSYAYR